MQFNFEEEATREHVWLRAFFMGPTGSGKSLGALELASKLFGGELPTTLINTERGRGKLYADRYKFGLIDLSGDAGGEVDHSTDTFIRAIDLAEQQTPGGVIILDSVSHEWMGRNGILAQADRFGDWKTVRPKHNAFVDRLLATRCHFFACCRAKMKYGVGEEEINGRTKQTITMLGVGPIQSDDLQYEFNLVARFDQATHEAAFSGHVDPLDGIVTGLVPADNVAEVLSKWLSEGDPQEEPEAASEAAVAALEASLTAESISAERIEAGFAAARVQNRGALHPDYVAEQLAGSQERLAKKAKAAEQPKQEAIA